MLIPTCWIELGRTVWSSDPCRFEVLGEVTGDGGLQKFPSATDVIHWNDGKRLDPLERSSDVRAQNFVLRDKVEAGEVPPLAMWVVEESAKYSGGITVDLKK